MQNLSEIKLQFAKVIGFSQGIPNPNLDGLFETWREAKRDIIEAFDGELIKEVPGTVQFQLDDKTKESYFKVFVNELDQIFDNRELVDFITQNKDGFYDNSVVVAYEKDDIKIPVGMKLVKAFKFFEKDKNALEQMQIMASQVIQENKIEGTLCFSVHPLDYLSISVNTYNWRSCHALDGEFRAGNLSYMCDKSTIVCYLRGANDVVLPMFPSDVLWNSKKWRVLIYLSKNWDMLFASKQYPFSSKTGLDITLDKLLEALRIESSYFKPWSCDYCDKFTRSDGSEMWLSSPYVPMHHKLIPIDELVVDDAEYPLHFNDVLRSSTYKQPYYTFKDNFWLFDISPDDKPIFKIGHDVKCLCCGENLITDTDLMACRKCADELNLGDEDCMVCDCCGSRVYDGEWSYVCGEVVCDSCFSSECFVCECCDEAFFAQDKVYDRETDEYVCINCYNSRREE